MKSFTTDKYSFEVNGKAYAIPALAFGDVDKVMSVFSVEASEQTFDRIRELLLAKADKRTTEAIESLSFRQIGELFRDWSDLTPGESSASGE